jgi:predicted lipase
MNDDQIKAAQEASRLAYQIRYSERTDTGNTLEDIQKKLGTNKLQIVEFEKNYPSGKKVPGGCVIETDDTIYIAFRGTSKKYMQEMYNDTKADKVQVAFKTKSGKEDFEIHRGFYEEYEAIRESLTPILKAINGEGGFKKKVVCCGHSLGGAVANITALKLACNGVSDINCVTFGAPKTFSKKTAEKYNELAPSSERHYHKNDLVRLYPMFREGYAHAGKATEIESSHRFPVHSMNSAYPNNIIITSAKDTNSIPTPVICSKPVRSRSI